MAKGVTALDDLEKMCNLHYKYVKSYALSLCLNETLAEDITQEDYEKFISIVKEKYSDKYIIRTHKDKKYAIIHDLVVIPENVSDNSDIERNLVESEIRRVRDFALLSENPSYSEVSIL